MKKSQLQETVQRMNDSDKKDLENTFKQFLNDKNSWKFSYHKKKKFQIIEDLAILYLILFSNQKNITSLFFKQISQIGSIKRTYQSLRTRYLKFLINLNYKDLMHIFDHANQHSTHGYLMYEKNIFKIFVPPKNEQEDLIIAQHDIKVKNTATLKCTCSFKNLEQLLHQNIQLSIKIKDQDIFDSSQSQQKIQNKLQQLQKQFNIDREELIKKFLSVSCDWNDLQDVLQNKNDHLIWQDYEDQIVLNQNQVDDPGLQYLTRIKSLKRVEHRKLFLQNNQFNKIKISY